MYASASLASIREQCEALIQRLTNPEIVPLPAPLVVPPPNLTPPGFDQAGVRSGSFPAANAAKQVMQSVGGVTSGSTDAHYDERNWRGRPLPPRSSPEEVVSGANGVSNGSQEKFSEGDLRVPSVRPGS